MRKRKKRRRGVARGKDQDSGGVGDGWESGRKSGSAGYECATEDGGMVVVVVVVVVAQGEGLIHATKLLFRARVLVVDG